MLDRFAVDTQAALGARQRRSKPPVAGGTVRAPGRVALGLTCALLWGWVPAQAQETTGARMPKPVPPLQSSRPAPSVSPGAPPARAPQPSFQSSHSSGHPLPPAMPSSPHRDSRPYESRPHSPGPSAGYPQRHVPGTAFGQWPGHAGHGGGYSSLPPPPHRHVEPAPRIWGPPPAWVYSAPRGVPHRYPAFGVRYRTLPSGYLTITHNGLRWHYRSGVWYRPLDAGYYVVSSPPAGMLVPTLPATYASIIHAGVPYFYANGVYYTPASDGGYLVTPPPTGIPAVPADFSGAEWTQAPTVFAAAELIITPRLGQTQAQLYTDRAQCSQRAYEQSGYDPARGPIEGDTQTEIRARLYRDAEVSCLEALGYDVR